MKIGLGIGIPRQKSFSGGGASFDTDYQALLAAASGDLPSASVQTAQNTLVVDLKAAGVWDKLDLFYVFATDGGDDIRRRNWKAPASFQATLVNAPTFTSLEGYTGNGTNMYINTNWTPSTDASNYTQNNASIGVYHRTIDTTNAAPTFFGSRNADGTSTVLSVWGRNTGRFTGLHGSASNTTQLTTTGFTYNNRASSTQITMYHNGVLFSTNSQTSDGFPNINMYLLARNDAQGSTINQYSPDQISIFFAGASLASEAAAFFTAVEKYMDAIGKGVVA